MAFLLERYLSNGIVPEIDTNFLKKYFSEMNEDDARKIKRKFRKAWRRSAKERARDYLSSKLKRRAKFEYAVGNGEDVGVIMTKRKQLVLFELMSQARNFLNDD